MRVGGRRVVLVIAALAPASLVLTHDLSFLAAYGGSYRAVLAATGHDARWSSTVTLVLVVSALLVAVGLARLGWLWLRARSVERGGAAGRAWDIGGYLRVLATIWPWLALTTAALFVWRENLEAAALGAPLPGIGPLLSGSSVPTPAILALVTFAIAALGALLLWGHDSLIARIEAARTSLRPAHSPLATMPPAPRTHAPTSILSLNLGRRAPPALVA
jgi:hypothetical protein